MGVAALALLALWGFAEATVFFVVADVAVSWIALRRGTGAGVRVAFASAAGSLLGIALLYGWAQDRGEAALALVDRVPWVTERLITEMREDLSNKGVIAVLEAGATGMPIKIAAVLAPEYGIAPLAFLVVGAIQRMARFALVALFAAFLARRLRRFWSERALERLWAGSWILFYAVYWSVLV